MEIVLSVLAQVENVMQESVIQTILGTLLSMLLRVQLWEQIQGSDLPQVRAVCRRGHSSFTSMEEEIRKHPYANVYAAFISDGDPCTAHIIIIIIIRLVTNAKTFFCWHLLMFFNLVHHRLLKLSFYVTYWYIAANELPFSEILNIFASITMQSIKINSVVIIQHLYYLVDYNRLKDIRTYKQL